MHPPHYKETNIKTLFRLILLLIPLTSFSQSSEFIKDSTISYVEIVGFGGTTSRTPFWMQANQYGIVPKNSPSGSIRAKLEKIWSLNEKNIWQVGAGVETAANYTEQKSNVLFPQIYGTLRFKNWELFVGRKKQFVGLADSTMGTGPYAWSGNALPIPKIQIGTVRFVNVPFTKGLISFQAFYSDGFFEKNRPVTSGLKFHQKALYLRLGRIESRFKLYGGINHQVQWGGSSPYLTAESNNLPDGFKNYLNVVRGAVGGVGESITHFDSTSRIGNHLGSIDIAFEVETYGSSWFVYRQFIYEDGSLFYLQALKDGLNGIRVKRKNSYGASFEVTEGVFEFLYTKDQGGDEFIITDGKKRGRDNYFNNQQVRDGWSYFGRTIGIRF